MSLLKISIVFCQIPMETSTTRLQEAKTFEIAGSFEFSGSKEITERSIPLCLIYGISNRLELAMQSVIYTSVSTSDEPTASGIGDFEVALEYLLFKERKILPSIALEGEVKIPTANNPLIGTQRFDYFATLIASKKFGNLDTHVNFGYIVVGQPEDIPLHNVFCFAAAGEFEISEKLELVTEILANNSSFLNETDEDRVLHPAIIPGEISGLVGARYGFTEKLRMALGVGYNNKKALLIRTGLIYCF
jgi:hypothetical protein